jgi:hypothetical protein
MSTALPAALIAELSALLGAEGWRMDDSALEANAQDNSWRRQRPAAVALPADVEQVQALVHACRAHGVALHYHRHDAIAHLPALLAQHPQACLWFDNLLGQLRYRFGDTDAAQDRLRQLHHDLRGHPWGSVHDAYSGRVRAHPTAINAPLALAFERNTSGVVHAGRAFTHSDWAQHLLASVGAEGEWLDHLTAEVLPPQTPGHMIPWAFNLRHWHWLQVGWVKNAD